MNAGADAAIVANRQHARTIKKRVGSNPAVLADLHIAVHVTVVINARPLAKSQALRALPAIRQKLLQRQIALPLFPHLEAEILVERDKRIKKIGRVLHELFPNIASCPEIRPGTSGTTAPR